MSKRKKEAEVIVFEEPKFKKRKSEKEMCRGADVTQLFSCKPPSGDDTSRKPQSRQTEELDFKATLREVQKYAVSSLSGKSKRRREEEQVLALGGKPAKNEKMPYPLYMKRVKAQKKNERREKRDMILAGTPVPKKKEIQHKSGRGKGRWRDSTRNIKPHIGASTRGGVILTDREISRVKKSSAPRKR